MRKHVHGCSITLVGESNYANFTKSAKNTDIPSMKLKKEVQNSMWTDMENVKRNTQQQAGYIRVWKRHVICRIPPVSTNETFFSTHP